VRTFAGAALLLVGVALLGVGVISMLVFVVLGTGSEGGSPRWNYLWFGLPWVVVGAPVLYSGRKLLRGRRR